MKHLIIASLALFVGFRVGLAFIPSMTKPGRQHTLARSQGTSTTSTFANAVATDLERNIKQLKKVLTREYASFFDPMEREYYSPMVTFEDPLVSLAGVESYQQNVDMLGARNWMGSLLFRDAGIILHSIKGGNVLPDGIVEDIITRWTLRFTFKALPWQPTARFSGISIYQVNPGGPMGVQVSKQDDYWDSINLVEGGQAYMKVNKGVAIADLLNQLKPSDLNAPAAAPELPFQLLRRGKDYEVRKYPSYAGATIAYDRRDEAFETLGAFCSGLQPLAPAIMQVSSDTSKTMTWPIAFAQPGEAVATVPEKAIQKQTSTPWTKCEIVIVPEQVVAVGSFADASTEPVVRRTEQNLLECCSRDGLRAKTNAQLVFAQYDAIFSMGRRRGEVWIELDDHPWPLS